METEDPRSWPIPTNVEGLPATSRTRWGVPHTVEALVDSRWLEVKAPPRAAWR